MEVNWRKYGIDPDEIEENPCGPKVKVIQCCGQNLECPDFTNTCPICKADYNWAGQRLAPRSQWGEETGESLSDILSVDGDRIDLDYE